jgi:hypothetical protein
VKRGCFILFLVILGSCTPARVTAPRLTVSVPLKQPSYYPFEAGFIWRYLEPGERLDAPMLVRENLGTTALGDEVYQLIRIYGRQAMTVQYYQSTEQGISLAREDHETFVLTYNPPREVYPSQLEVGQSWQGSSGVRLLKENREVATLLLVYHASVIREQVVTIQQQTFTAFVIAFEDQYGDKLVSGERWFVPFVGEVRTREGHYLVERNFR